MLCIRSVPVANKNTLIILSRFDGFFTCCLSPFKFENRLSVDIHFGYIISNNLVHVVLFQTIKPRLSIYVVIFPIIEAWVDKGSIMVSDEHRSYNTLSPDYFHVAINHQQGEYVRGGFTNNGIENFWSLFKRGIIGIYHQVSPKHLHRYSTEFSYRYNSRNDSATFRFTNTIKNANSTRLKYKDLIK